MHGTTLETRRPPCTDRHENVARAVQGYLAHKKTPASPFLWLFQESIVEEFVNFGNKCFQNGSKNDPLFHNAIPGMFGDMAALEGLRVTKKRSAV